MTKAEKATTIELLREKFNTAQYFYLADSSTLTVEEVNNLRRLCFDKQIELKVAKNTLIRKALEQGEREGYEPLYDVLKGPTSIMFTEVSNAPARLIEEFRDKNDNERPLLKAAYIDTDVFVGNDQLETLSKLKSKDELLGEVIGLLQSPAKNVISALQSSGQTLAALLQALEERESA